MENILRASFSVVAVALVLFVGAASAAEAQTTPILPSPDEVIQSRVESQDTGWVVPVSLYRQVIRLSSSSSCQP